MKELELVNEKPVKLGELYLDHDIIITDPCYKEDTWFLKEYELPTQGMYDCYYTEDNEIGRVVASIFVVLSGTTDVIKGDLVGDCGVDSGQLGIFNLANYRKAVSQELFNTTNKGEFIYADWERKWDENDSDEEKFYKACCNLTLSNDRLGILDGVGFVSASGFGDGMYPVYELEDENGNVVGLRVDFVEED